MILGIAFLKSFQAIVLLSDFLPAFYLRLFIGAMIIVFAIVNQYFDKKAK
jgi:ribose/xylose/arabinose/galactoside ABC-type transport system permease subunit